MDARKIKMAEAASAFMTMTKTEEPLVTAIHTQFDAYKGSLNINREALANIVESLSRFHGLKGLFPNDLTKLAEAMVAQINFDVALTQLFKTLSLASGDAVTQFIAGEYEGHVRGFRLSKRQQEDIETWLPRGLAGVKDIPDLNAKVLDARAQIQLAAPVPADLIASIIQVAKKYQAHSRPLGLSSGQIEANREFQNLIQTHPFFKTIEVSDGDRLHYAWNKATTESLVVSLLSSYIDSSAVTGLQMRLSALEWGIRFLKQNTSP